MKGFLLSIFVFSAVLAAVRGLKCYQCAGTEDACKKETLEGDKKYEKTCTSGLDTCMRQWSKKDGKTTVANLCNTAALCKAAEDACKNYDGDGECVVGCCTKDLCNAGSPVSLSVFLMTVCSALSLALLK